MRAWIRGWLLLGASLTLAADAFAYPLDGLAESGIRRLQGYLNANTNPPGGRWVSSDIRLHLLGHDGDFDSRPEDQELSAALGQLLRDRDPSYAMVVVDLSDANAIRWAGLRPDLRQNPGSVGKLVCMLALFDALAQAFPDLDRRRAVLRDTWVEAGDWVLGDEHKVPRYEDQAGNNSFAILRPDDVFRLSEWIDHAISASANGAGSVIWREAMLIRHFGQAYPADREKSEAFFRVTPKSELGRLARSVVDDALERATLDSKALMQGSFFTGTGKRYVPGGQSYATPRELVRFMFRMEQGRLVDEWSSLEMKKYTYMSKRRYRYVYAPELATSAVYFKSGSLYQCRPEEGYRCAKYMGNARNLMNSITLVETRGDGNAQRRYIVGLMSNVLKFNSAWDHARIGAAVHTLIEQRRPVMLQEEAGQKVLSKKSAGATDERQWDNQGER